MFRILPLSTTTAPVSNISKNITFVEIKKNDWLDISFFFFTGKSTTILLSFYFSSTSCSDFSNALNVWHTL